MVEGGKMIKTEEERIQFLEKNDGTMDKKLYGYSNIALIKLEDEEFMLNVRDFEGNNIPHFHLTNEKRDIAICMIKPWYFTHNSEVHILSDSQLKELCRDLNSGNLWKDIFYEWDSKTDNRSILGKRLITPNYKIITAVVFGQPESFSETWNDILIHRDLLKIPKMKVKWKYFIKHNVNYVLYFKRYGNGIKLTW